ncbi:cation transport protein-domain-containing protein [Lipomyces arxii]|uniref:cation transport protein-domain-containing protein n=1 Tax=Lipomyces arxii TaxID=56418 RepID=UPI0034CDBD0B
MVLGKVVDYLHSVVYSIFKPRFILFHAIYLAAMAIIGSIAVYPERNLNYIDALFLAMGATTQSGLNTVDLNNMTTWQQIALYIVPIFTNPISIHAFLVFIRLYWFEKAFQDIAAKSRIDHRLRKARSYAATEANRDIEMNGVAGRPITVLHTARMTEANFPGYRRFTMAPNQDGMSSEGGRSSTESYDIEQTRIGRRRSSDLGAPIESNQENDSEPFQVPDRLKQRSDSDAVLSAYNGSKIPWRKRSFGARNSSFDFGERRVDSLDSAAPDVNSRDIRFADLPSPRDQGRHSHSFVDSGPALIIKSPREQDYEEEQAAAEAKRSGSEIKFVSPVVNARSGLRALHKAHKSPVATVSEYGHEFKSRRQDSMNGDADEEDLTFALRPTKSHNIPHSVDSPSSGPVKVLRRAITIEAPGSKQESGARTEKRTSVGDFFFNRSQTMERAERIISRAFRQRRDDSPDGARSQLSSRSLALPYLSYEPTVARNSLFIGLTDEQRDELGGVEYRALRTLAVVLIAYFVFFFMLGNICLIPWILYSRRYSAIVKYYSQRPAWWASFMASSSFLDVGLSTVPTSLVEFQTAVFPLLLMSFLIVIGNTGFPCMLRLTIWILSKLFPAGSATSESLHFLLDHPRRCFTLLFPSGPTWWLLAVLVILNGADLILFIILDLKNTVLTDWDAGQRVLDGLFQAFSTRTAGLSVIDLSQLHPGVQVSYLIMMYISVLPIAISVRRTNVYEEQSLGIYVSPDENLEDEEEDGYSEIDESDHEDTDGAVRRATGNGRPEEFEKAMRRRPSTGVLSVQAAKHKYKQRKRKQKRSFVANHLRRQLSFDLWFIFLGLFIICIADGHKIQNGGGNFTAFAVLFEVVSAYGTVGLSLGYPNTTTSFSAQFSTISKLVIILLMFRGRHRGLPYAVDRAIMLPSQSLQKKDLKNEAQNERRMSATLNQNLTMPKSHTFTAGSQHDFGA